MGIINSIKFRDKMYKRLRLTNSASPMYETLEKNLENFNCILQRNTAIFFYNESKFNKYISNVKQTWTTINELLNKCNNKKDFPSYFIINGDKIDNKDDIANNFNSFSRWRHQMEPYSALLALCAGNSPVTGEQRLVTRSFYVFFHLRYNSIIQKRRPS